MRKILLYHINWFFFDPQNGEKSVALFNVIPNGAKRNEESLSERIVCWKYYLQEIPPFGSNDSLCFLGVVKEVVSKADPFFDYLVHPMLFIPSASRNLKNFYQTAVFFFTNQKKKEQNAFRRIVPFKI
ncbi:MAG: hypothetical protein H0V01_09705 [Bacteroidetes bacterium]|nr:hypothetical protein [Bacteroidota bacterium]HET6243121.1 hypothetical protein [Bacteroidia bacterium]